MDQNLLDKIKTGSNLLTVMHLKITPVSPETNKSSGARHPHQKLSL
jgi:hypothetical protein